MMRQQPAADAPAPERGSVTPWVLGLSVLLLLLAVAVVDLGRAVSDRRTLASMADAAASAGASGLDESEVLRGGNQTLALELVRQRVAASIAAQPDPDRRLLTQAPEVDLAAGQVQVRLRGKGRVGVLDAVVGDIPLQVTARATPRRSG